MSTREELQDFEYQLETINQSLAEDPDNADLLTLRDELSNLIALTKEYLGEQARSQPVASSSKSATAAQSSTSGRSKAGANASTTNAAAGGTPTASSSSSSNAATTTAAAAAAAAPSVVFTAGQDVLARWHVDGKMYQARIVSVSGGRDDPVYTVIFNIDKSTEVVRKNDVKPLAANDTTSGGSSKKRAYDGQQSPHLADGLAGGAGEDGGAAGASGSDREGGAAGGGNKKLKKIEKVEKKAAKEGERKARVAEQNAKQNSWQSFAKKAAKKGTHIPGVTGESQFRTPDNPYGRVGVVGSGKGMTSFEQKKRAVWDMERDA